MWYFLRSTARLGTDCVVISSLAGWGGGDTTKTQFIDGSSLEAAHHTADASTRVALL